MIRVYSLTRYGSDNEYLEVVFIDELDNTITVNRKKEEPHTISVNGRVSFETIREVIELVEKGTLEISI